MFWRGSPHESRAMACVDCHQAHQVVKPSLSHDACGVTRCGERNYSAPRTCRTARVR
jgi:hypothetical protein